MGQHAGDDWAEQPGARAAVSVSASRPPPGPVGDSSASRAPDEPPKPVPARRFGRVLRKSTGFSLVEVLVGDSSTPIGYCVLGPGTGVAATWLLGLPQAELAFAVRVSAEARNPKRRRPIRRNPRE